MRGEKCFLSVRLTCFCWMDIWFSYALEVVSCKSQMNKWNSYVYTDSLLHLEHIFLQTVNSGWCVNSILNVSFCYPTAHRECAYIQHCSGTAHAADDSINTVCYMFDDRITNKVVWLCTFPDHSYWDFLSLVKHEGKSFVEWHDMCNCFISCGWTSDCVTTCLCCVRHDWN
jgi:hypothetical protein